MRKKLHCVTIRNRWIPGGESLIGGLQTCTHHLLPKDEMVMMTVTTYINSLKYIRGVGSEEFHGNLLWVSVGSLGSLFYISHSTNVPMDQWTNGKMVQWTNGPEDQWTNGPMDQRSNGPMDQRSNGPMDQRSNGPMDQRSN